MIRRLGKRPAVNDIRIPRWSVAVPWGLPAPPPSVNWYAGVGSWPMLGNDSVGDCVVAAAMHALQQETAYAHPGHGLHPSEAEAITAYSAIGGYVPGDDSTDQGLTVLGHGGLIEFWTVHGLRCGGKLNKLTGAVRIAQPDPVRWQQAVASFGSLMVGLSLPQAILPADADPPFLWDMTTGPIAGGHEVLLVGYETVGSERVWDLISWGKEYRATERFLLATVDEAVAVFDLVALDARGINAAGIDRQTLQAYMHALARAS